MRTTISQKKEAVKNVAVPDGKATTNPLQLKQPVNNPLQLQAEETTTPQPRQNNTGLPDNLKAGVEALSGYSMDDVKVHYNSDKPTQLQALAYAQGTDIHIAPGQEKHLPHEAWHVVQQKQGRVQPTIQMKQGVAVNDDKGLEEEADVMGKKALNVTQTHQSSPAHSNQASIQQQIIQPKLKAGVLNVAAETHDEYDTDVSLRPKEQKLATQRTGGGYWTESEFKVTEDSIWWGTKKGQSGDPILFQFLQALELIDPLAGKHFSTLDPGILTEAATLREITEQCIQLLGGGVVNRYQSLVKEYASDLITLNEAQQHAADDLSPKIRDMNRVCADIYNGINVDGSLKILAIDIVKLQKTCTTLNNDIKKLGAILNDNKAMTQENIRVPRSTKMHFSAQASFETPGIWKIGNNHYKDISDYIRGTFVKNPKYNLLSKKEFNDERDKFTP